MYVSYYTHIPHAEARHFLARVVLLVEICTCGQTMVQNHKPVTSCGRKGLTSDERPNDGSKVAKRCFKSHLLRPLQKRQPLALASRPTRPCVPRE